MRERRWFRIKSQESKDTRFEEFQSRKRYRKHSQDKNLVEEIQSRSNTKKVHFKEHIQVVYENINTNWPREENLQAISNQSQAKRALTSWLYPIELPLKQSNKSKKNQKLNEKRDIKKGKYYE